MQESKDVLNYEKMHSIDKRRAAIDSRYRAFVTNKAFTDYFEYEHFYTITDFVHPDEVGRLKSLSMNLREIRRNRFSVPF